MGLFTKRSGGPDELAALRSEIAAMAARLDATDGEKARLEQRVAQLTATVNRPAPEPKPAPPPPPPILTQAELDILRARIQRLADRLDDPSMQPRDPAMVDDLAGRLDRLADDVAAAQAAAAHATGSPTVDPADHAALLARVDAIQARLDTPIAPPPAPPQPVAPPPTVDPAELDDVRSRLEALHDRVAAMDARITSIATELANQLSELSGDVDELGRREPAAASPSGEIDPAAMSEAVDEIRDAQVRLANEQARYQIAFRHDLAELAERLRRS